MLIRIFRRIRRTARSPPILRANGRHALSCLAQLQDRHAGTTLFDLLWVPRFV